MGGPDNGGGHCQGGAGGDSHPPALLVALRTLGGWWDLASATTTIGLGRGEEGQGGEKEEGSGAQHGT